MQANSRQKEQAFTKRVYLPRMIGLGLGSICVAAVLYEQAAHYLWWLLLCSTAFLWPHLAYFRLKNSKRPYRGEMNNFYFDSFLGGLWLPVMQFSILPSVVIFSMLSFDNIAVGGLKLFFRGLAAQALGLATGIAIVGFSFKPEASLLLLYACLPMLTIYPIFLGFVTYQLSAKLVYKNKQLKKLSTTDSLTNVFNRGHWEAQVQAEFLRSNKSHLNSALLMLDVDDFKQINDKYGHLTGDQVLKAIASELKTQLSDNQIIGRFGGEEFAILFHESNPDQALALAEQLRKSINLLSLGSLCPRELSISVGVASIEQGMADASQWINAADNAMSQAKHQGKNQVVVAPISSPASIPFTQ